MTIAVILYTSNTMANGEHPLMLRISQGIVRKYVSLGISSPLTLWDIGRNLPKRQHPNKASIEIIIAKTIAAYKAKFLELRGEEQVVTPQALAQAMEAPIGKEINKVFSFFDRVIDRLLQGGKVGNANVYKDTKRSLKHFTKHFTGSTNLLFADINQSFLLNYETFLRKLGLAETSMSLYFRTLRALFSKAIQEKLITLNEYPFKEFSVAKFNTCTKKRAITKEEIKK
jgi:hypothetical protein